MQNVQTFSCHFAYIAFCNIKNMKYAKYVELEPSTTSYIAAYSFAYSFAFYFTYCVYFASCRMHNVKKSEPSTIILHIILHNISQIICKPLNQYAE